MIPLELLFGEPERSAPRLTRDGAAVAYLAPYDGVRNVWIQPFGGDPRPLTRSPVPVHDFALPYGGDWCVFVVDDAGKESWRLHAVHPRTEETHEVFAREGVQAELAGVGRARPGCVAFRANDRDAERHDLWVHDLAARRGTRVARNPGLVEWGLDDALRPVAGVRVDDDAGMTILVRRDGGDWAPLVRFEPDDAMVGRLLTVAPGGDAVLLADPRGRDTAALVRIPVAGGPARLLHADPRYDVEDVVTEPGTGRPQWAIVEAERRRLAPLHDGVRADLARLADLDDGDPVLRGRDTADRHWLVNFVSDVRSTRTYRYDRRTGRADLAFRARPALDEYTLGARRPITFTARDGLRIEGYLTLPPRGAPPYPLILLVHGGPWERDRWGYDPEAGWLADRGIACLQVNYRGSTGYGTAFVNAGNREWGRRMQDDLIDAVDWAVERGHALPGRIGVCGGSYGGYAALLAATRPDRFACAISLMGQVDLVNLIRSVPPYWRPALAMLHRCVGDPDADAEELLARSPITLADRMSVPLLLVHGANDPRVPIADLHRLVARLEERGTPPDLLVFDDEGHGLVDPGNRLRFYRQAEGFIARHLLGPRTVGPSKPLTGSRR